MTVFVVGQFPPPVNGFSFVTEEVARALGARHEIRACNVGPPPAESGLAKHYARARRVASAAWMLLRGRRSGRHVCYLGCEGGAGLMYTLLLVIVARLSRIDIILHHHSFSYINERASFVSLVCRIGAPNLTHVFLCDIMRTRFEALYGEQRAVILSNAAFVVPQDLQARDARQRPLRLGLLSNLNEEKGLHRFLDLAARASAMNLDADFVLAGPVADPEDGRRIEAAVQRLGGALRYLGPLYGQSKLDFFSEIDVFVFPTEYANEAQPTVVFEALAFGSQVVAVDRGCIRRQVGRRGACFAPHSDFVDQALSWLQSTLANRGEWSFLRRETMADYRAMHEHALQQLSALVSLCGSGDQRREGSPHHDGSLSHQA